MKLHLVKPNSNTNLSEVYRQAFSEGIEIIIVSAYLTSWDETLVIGDQCKRLKVIVGKDFGITRKVACRSLLNWLPSHLKHSFLIADGIQGFHPKAVFWKTKSGTCKCLLGSSNLTVAAFYSNFEANAHFEISNTEFQEAKNWVSEIIKHSVPVSEEWIDTYIEAITERKSDKKSNELKSSITIELKIPLPPDAIPLINKRQEQISQYEKYRGEINGLFQSCAEKKINSEEFYKKINELWNYTNNNRLQYSGWERRGKYADFQELSRWFMEICEASPDDRDDVVITALDALNKSRNSARRAFFSEMLCLSFPDSYPVLNAPVDNFLKENKFRGPNGATEGAKYIDLARKLRFFLTTNKTFPAKNLAELDTLIWSVFGKRS